MCAAVLAGLEGERQAGGGRKRKRKPQFGGLLKTISTTRGIFKLLMTLHKGYKLKDQTSKTPELSQSFTDKGNLMDFFFEH